MTSSRLTAAAMAVTLILLASCVGSDSTPKTGKGWASEPSTPPGKSEQPTSDTPKVDPPKVDPPVEVKTRDGGVDLTAHARVDEWSDPIKIELPAGRDLEFKLILAQGATVHYEWQAEGELVYDFHGEPTGAKAGEFTSFEKGTSRSSTGSLNAPFTGRIGWWWKNEKMSAITVMLKLKGAYQLADE